MSHLTYVAASAFVEKILGSTPTTVKRCVNGGVKAGHLAAQKSTTAVRRLERPVERARQGVLSSSDWFSEVALCLDLGLAGPALAEAVAVAIHLEDMDVVG